MNRVLGHQSVKVFDVRAERSRGKGDGSGWLANTVVGEDNSCPSESGESHADDIEQTPGYVS